MGNNMKFPYNVAMQGKPTATILAGSAFDAGMQYAKEFAPDYRQMMTAKLVATSGHNQWRQEAHGSDSAVVLWISEAF